MRLRFLYWASVSYWASVLVLGGCREVVAGFAFGTVNRPIFFSFFPRSQQLRARDNSGGGGGGSVSGERPPQRKLRPVTVNDIECKFSRSGGAGGQNVNKVSTKAEIRLDLERHGLSFELIRELQRTERSRLVRAREGELVLSVASSRHRTQAMNLRDAIAKANAILQGAAKRIEPPPPPSAEKVKRMRKLSNKETRNRLQAKKQKGDKKKNRKKPRLDD